jgi:hypothetical protein
MKGNTTTNITTGAGIITGVGLIIEGVQAGVNWSLIVAGIGAIIHGIFTAGIFKRQA